MKIDEIQICDNIKYYFLPCSLGDTLMVSSLVSIHPDVCFLIKKEHEPIMNFLGVQNYACIKSSRDTFIRDISNNGLRCLTPTKGKIYISHPLFNPNERNWMQIISSGCCNFLDWYKKYLNIDENISPYCVKTFPPKLKTDTITKIKQVTNCELSDVIIFYPQCCSMPALPSVFWEMLYNKIKSENHNVSIISNRYVSNQIPTIYLTLEESLSLMHNVRHIYSVRSGICDLFQVIGSKLSVIYPPYKTLFDVYSINRMVRHNKINEFILRNNNIMEKMNYE